LARIPGVKLIELSAMIRFPFLGVLFWRFCQLGY
jgi:hypothetical protein